MTHLDEMIERFQKEGLREFMIYPRTSAAWQRIPPTYCELRPGISPACDYDVYIEADLCGTLKHMLSVGPLIKGPIDERTIYIGSEFTYIPSNIIHVVFNGLTKDSDYNQIEIKALDE